MNKVIKISKCICLSMQNKLKFGFATIPLLSRKKYLIIVGFGEKVKMY